MRTAKNDRKAKTSVQQANNMQKTGKAKLVKAPNWCVDGYDIDIPLEYLEALIRDADLGLIERR